MNKLFLDDIRNPWDNSWDIVRTPAEFKTYIKEMFVKTKKLPDVIAFDHDLNQEHYTNEMYSNDPEQYNRLYKGFKHETGLDCAKWLCSFCVDEGLKLPEIHIHSMNPIGANNIAYTVMNYALFYFEEELLIQPKPYHTGPPVGF